MSTEDGMEAEEDSETLHWRDGIDCPECGAVNAPEHRLFVEFFENGVSTCNRCAQGFDLWAHTIHGLTTWPTSWVAFRLLGAMVTRITIDLVPERNAEVNLTEIPEKAEILKVHFMSQSPAEGQPVFPALSLLMNNMRLEPFPRHFFLYGMSHGRPNVVPSQVWIAITWIDPAHEELSVHHLADAAKQFAAERYNGMIIPANVAVEAALTPAMNAWVRTYCSREATDDFLGARGATYAHQLKVLSSIASRALAIKPMPKGILAILDDLRGYRNDLGHRGVLDHPKRPPPDLAKAANFLTASIFGYHYARYLRENIPEATGTGSRS